MIDPNHPVRVVNKVIDSLDLDVLLKKYKGGGCSDFVDLVVLQTGTPRSKI
jgi:transposase